MSNKMILTTLKLQYIKGFRRGKVYVKRHLVKICITFGWLSLEQMFDDAFVDLLLGVF